LDLIDSVYVEKILWKEYSESIGDLWLKHKYPAQPVMGVGVIIGLWQTCFSEEEC